MVLRKAALLLIGCLLCAFLEGCTVSKTTDPLPVEPEEVLTIDISVEDSLSDEVQEGVRLFASKINRLSGQNILLNIYYESNPYQSMLDGNADIIYCSSDTMERWDDHFSIYSSPFFFRSYEHMTMTLNSTMFDDLTRDAWKENLQLKKLAAVYGGTSVLLSSKRYIIDGEDLKDLNVGTYGDSDFQYVLEQFGATTQGLDAQSRYDRFYAGRVDTIDCSSKEIGQLELGGLEDAFLAETFHRTSVEWLFVNSTFYEGLSKTRQAILQEAAAYLVSTIDSARLKSYSEDIQKQSAVNLTVTRLDLESIRSQAKQYLYSKPDFNTRTDWEFYDSVQAIIR